MPTTHGITEPTEPTRGVYEGITVANWWLHTQPGIVGNLGTPIAAPEQMDRETELRAVNQRPDDLAMRFTVAAQVLTLETPFLLEPEGPPSKFTATSHPTPNRATLRKLSKTVGI